MEYNFELFENSSQRDSSNQTNDEGKETTKIAQ